MFGDSMFANVQFGDIGGNENTAPLPALPPIYIFTPGDAPMGDDGGNY